jgi:hypothetical protein
MVKTKEPHLDIEPHLAVPPGIVAPSSGALRADTQVGWLHPPRPNPFYLKRYCACRRHQGLPTSGTETSVRRRFILGSSRARLLARGNIHGGAGLKAQWRTEKYEHPPPERRNILKSDARLSDVARSEQFYTDFR